MLDADLLDYCALLFCSVESIVCFNRKLRHMKVGSFLYCRCEFSDLSMRWVVFCRVTERVYSYFDVLYSRNGSLNDFKVSLLLDFFRSCGNCVYIVAEDCAVDRYSHSSVFLLLRSYVYTSYRNYLFDDDEYSRVYSEAWLNYLGIPFLPLCSYLDLVYKAPM